MSSEPIFRREGGVLVPTAQAIGPWDGGQLHGGGPAALIAAAIQDLAPDMQVARLGLEFLGPVPAVPLEVEARLTKPGRRLQLASATVSAEGRAVLTATATLLRRAEVDTGGAGRWDVPLPAPPPDDPAHRVVKLRDDDGFDTTGLRIRCANDTGFDRTGPGQAWFALQRDLVGGEPVPPVCRALVAADFPNGLSTELPWDGWLFINCDLTVSLLRDPAGEWVLLDARTRIDPSGIGWASATLFDERGPIGFSHQTLFVAPR